MIPKPADLRLTGGECILTSELAIIGTGNIEATNRYLRDKLLRMFLLDTISSDFSVPGRRSIRLEISPESEINCSEGYRLSIQPHEIVIRASGEAGLFYGVQTLLLILSQVPKRQDAGGPELTVPCVEIVDSPRFSWRGVMLDVVRHYMPIEFLYKFIDTLAMHKVNMLQLHLTDDQGVAAGDQEISSAHVSRCLP